MQEAVEALHDILSEANLEHHFEPTGVLKPARDPAQAAEFEDAASRWPEHGTWLGREAAAERWPWLSTGHGVLRVDTGGVVRMPALCEALVDAACRRDATFLRAEMAGWSEKADGVEVRFRRDSPLSVTARRLLLAIGAGYRAFPDLTGLSLHPIKGQWIELTRPQTDVEIEPVSFRRYLAPIDNRLVVGGTYEHSFTHARPTSAAGLELAREAEALVPGLKPALPGGADAGIRVTVPGIRLPMIGPLPGRRRIWIFTGLGSKGLLMAPLLARELPEFFTQPLDIPRQIRVN
jgi:glycine oxidase